MASKLSADDLDTCAQVRAACACGTLRRAARLITQRYDHAIAPSGVKVTQLPLLVALGAHGPVPLTPLAEVLALDRTTLTRNLKVLEERGFATLRPDEYDARVRLAAITDDGAHALSRALALWKDVHGAVVEEFGEPRLRSLYGELSTLTEVSAG
ncbi:MAG: MarR family winged helix-turn-helix transcriptional regulator [Solirubrobacteraceae bacterium]